MVKMVKMVKAVFDEVPSKHPNSLPCLPFDDVCGIDNTDYLYSVCLLNYS